MGDAQPLTATLRFDAGTLSLAGIERDDPRIAPLDLKWDARSAVFWAPAVSYAAIVLALRRAGVSIADEARR